MGSHAQAPPRANPPVGIEALPKGAMLGIFFHQFGHMVISELGLPSTGPEESAVDELSTILLAEVMIRVPQSQRESYAEIIMGSALFGKFSAEEARTQGKGIPFHAEHAPDERRFADILCLAAGADPFRFMLTAAKAGIAEDRLRRCAKDYEKRRAAWDGLMTRATGGRTSSGTLSRCRSCRRALWPTGASSRPMRRAATSTRCSSSLPQSRACRATLRSS